MNGANLHSSSIAVYAYFIAPPHLQYFAKVVVQPSVLKNDHKLCSVYRAAFPSIFSSLSITSSSRRGSSCSHRTTVHFSCNRRSYSRRRVVVTQDHSSRRDSHHNHRSRPRRDSHQNHRSRRMQMLGFRIRIPSLRYI